MRGTALIPNCRSKRSSRGRQTHILLRCAVLLLCVAGAGIHHAGAQSTPSSTASRAWQPFPPVVPPPPGGSLRIGTFNAQFIADAPDDDAYTLCCDDIPNRPAKLAERILAGGYDVIVLNEVFRSGVQSELVKRLRPEFPHVVQFLEGDGRHCHIAEDDTTFDPATGTVCGGVSTDLYSDSGLMLFSKLPFDPLPEPKPFRAGEGNLIAFSGSRRWGDVAFTGYGVCTGNDCYTNKGAGLVRLRHPDSGRRYTIVFTHLQAGESSVKQAVRRSQLQQIERLIRGSLTDVQLRTETVLLLGDLNINGDRHVMAAEWVEHLNTAGSFFSDYLSDAWFFDTSELDRGLTSNVPRTPGPFDARTRLDYILRNRVADVLSNAPLCFQHLTLALNLRDGEPFREGGFGLAGSQDLSDHLGVNADINLAAPHCRPPDAMQLGDSDFNVINSSRTLRGSNVRIQHPGGMQWVRIDTPGTYSFAIRDTDDGSIDYRVYAATNLSTPLTSHRGTRTEFADEQGQRHVGRTFHLPEAPFFVRVFHPDRTWTGSYELIIHQHRGASREDAVVLAANRPETHRRPTGALGATETWFRIDTDAPFVADRAQALRFFIDPLGAPPESYTIELLAADGTTVLADSPAGGIEIHRSDVADNRATRYLVVRPADLDRAEPFGAGWETNLTMLRTWRGAPDDWLLRLKAVVQTDWPDLGGEDDDSLRLQVTVDGVPAFFVTPEGPEIRVDHRPQLGAFDSGQVKSLEHVLPCPIGFLERIDVELQEDDDVVNFNDDLLRGRIGPLLVEELNTLRQSLRLDEAGGDGQYQFDYNLSHNTYGLLEEAAERGDRFPTCRSREP